MSSVSTAGEAACRLGLANRRSGAAKRRNRNGFMASFLVDEVDLLQRGLRFDLAELGNLHLLAPVLDRDCCRSRNIRKSLLQQFEIIGYARYHAFQFRVFEESVSELRHS